MKSKCILAVSGLMFMLSGCVIEIAPKYANYSEKQKSRVTLRILPENSLAAADPSKVYLITPKQISEIVDNSDFDTLKVYYGKIGCPTAKNHLKNNKMDEPPRNLLLYGGTDDWAYIHFLDYRRFPAGVYKFVLNDSVSYNYNPNKSLASVYEYYNLPYDSVSDYKLVLTYDKNKKLVDVEK